MIEKTIPRGSGYVTNLHANPRGTASVTNLYHKLRPALGEASPLPGNG